MANSRMILIAFFGLVFSLLAPASASAQHVHEVRPSAADEVIIGTEDNASMDAVVALARRLTGNTALTSEDVIANLPHARRYACRLDGQLVYFGTNPEYRGRCPDSGVRTDGVLRHTSYHVPRVHGVVLSHATRYTRHATHEPTIHMEFVHDPAQDAEIERLREENARLVVDRDTALAERDEARVEASATNVEIASLQSEFDAARTALATRPPPTVVRVVDTAAGAEIARQREEITRLIAERDAARSRSAGEVTIRSRLYGAPIAIWLALLIALFIFLLWPISRSILKPHLAYREVLEEKGKDLATEVEGSRQEVKVLKRDLDREIIRKGKLKGLLKRVWKSRTRIFARIDDLTRDLESYASRFTPFQVRKERIGVNHAKLAELREMEDAFDAPTVQIEIAEAMRAEAETAGDLKTVANCDQVIEIFRDRIAKLAFDPEALKTQIKYLVTQLDLDMREQCGIDFESRPALEIKSDYEERLREEKREAEAAKRTYEALRFIVEEQGLSGRSDLVQARLALENGFAVREGHLEGRYWLNASVKHDAEQESRLDKRTLLKLRGENATSRQDIESLRGEVAELNQLMGALVGDPTEHAKSIMAREARIIDLEMKLKEAGIDPGRGPRLSADFWNDPQTDPPSSPEGGNGTPSMGMTRPRMPTQAISAQRDSQLPGPPSSPMSALNRDIYRFLDTLRSLPEDAWIIDCNDDAGRDWAFLLNKCLISVQSLGGVVELKKYLQLVKKRAPAWLEERSRRRTDPPGAPVAT